MLQPIAHERDPRHDVLVGVVDIALQGAGQVKGESRVLGVRDRVGHIDPQAIQPGADFFGLLRMADLPMLTPFPVPLCRQPIAPPRPADEQGVGRAAIGGVDRQVEGFAVREGEWGGWGVIGVHQP